MKVKIYGKNIEVTDALRDAVEKKLSKLERFLDHSLEGTATLKVERGQHIMEITAQTGHLMLRAEESSADMYGTIDMVADKLEKQLAKYRTRLQRRRRNVGSDDAAAVSLVGTSEAEAEQERVVRVKRFAVKPSTVDEAIMQMNLLGHDFHLFRNGDTGLTSVVYRRKDGDYGLLEPEA